MQYKQSTQSLMHRRELYANAEARETAEIASGGTAQIEAGVGDDKVLNTNSAAGQRGRGDEVV
jgi:hypothetical protein|eukprot:SAG25_NODE_1263_length_3466_cov_2.420552_7_plen_63_part_00